MFVTFFNSKKDAIKDVTNFIEELKAKNKKSPKYIRLDNLGENHKFSKLMKKIDPSIIF